MIRIRNASDRGKTKTGWLDSNHTFSFNRYYDPECSGFRQLLVINEDFVAPSQGFATHSHRDMEILSYVVAGELAHKDSTGTSAIIRPGELQRMTAGTGVSHSEFNPSSVEPVHFLQIWIKPAQISLKPAYEQRKFPEADRRGKLRLIASQQGDDDSVTIHQDVRVFDAMLDAGAKVSFQIEPGRYAWIQVVKGSIRINDATLATSDGAAISNEASITILAIDAAEILLFDLA